MYSVERNTYFEFTNQKLIQLEYEFSISGKRIKAVKQAIIEHEIAQFAYSDVLRGYVIEYSNLYSKLIALNQKNKIYESFLNNYSFLIKSYEKQLELGGISLNELVRLKTEYLNIQNLIILNKNELLNTQASLATILNLSNETTIEPEERLVSNTLLDNYKSILNEAIENRPDYKIMQKNPELYKQGIKVQKAEAIPDIKFGYQPHDKGSNYVRPYSGIVFEMGIPIFNRNQGEIKKSKIKLEQSKLELDYFKLKMENDIMVTFEKLNNAQKMLNNFSPEFIKNVDELTKQATMNFEKKNISIIQYIDYQTSYLNFKIQQADAQYQYFEAINQINFEAGKELTN
jgi:cobalt-zinc-cadmium efflux system outer membrane protein